MPVTISVCMSIASFYLCPSSCPVCVWEWVGVAVLEFSWELHSMRGHIFYTALQWVPHWKLAFNPAQRAGQCILHQTAGEAVLFLFLSTFSLPHSFGKSAVKYSAVFASASSNLASCEAFLGEVETICIEWIWWLYFWPEECFWVGI